MCNEGDFAKIIGNKSKHGFFIGTLVQIIKATSDEIMATNGVEFYFVDEGDIEPFEECIINKTKSNE